MVGNEFKTATIKYLDELFAQIAGCDWSVDGCGERVRLLTMLQAAIPVALMSGHFDATEARKWTEMFDRVSNEYVSIVSAINEHLRSVHR